MFVKVVQIHSVQDTNELKLHKSFFNIFTMIRQAQNLVTRGSLSKSINLINFRVFFQRTLIASLYVLVLLNALFTSDSQWSLYVEMFIEILTIFWLFYFILPFIWRSLHFFPLFIPPFLLSVRWSFPFPRGLCYKQSFLFTHKSSSTLLHNENVIIVFIVFPLEGGEQEAEAASFFVVSSTINYRRQRSIRIQKSRISQTQE